METTKSSFRASALRFDALAVSFAVGVVADEVGFEYVGQFGGQGGDPAVGTDRRSPFVFVFVPGHRAVDPSWCVLRGFMKSVISGLPGRKKLQLHGCQFGTEPTNGGGVAAPSEGVEPGLRVVLVDDAGVGRPPAAADADANIGMGGEIADVAGVAAVFGDDPPGFAFEAKPDDIAPPLPASAPCRFDQDMARTQTGPHEELDRRVEEIALEEPDPPAFAVRVHTVMLPQRQAGEVESARPAGTQAPSSGRPDWRRHTVKKARDIMSGGVEFISLDATIQDAAQKLAANDIGVLPICNGEGRLQGMLTDRDIVVKVVAAGMDPATTTVETVAQGTEVVTIGADDSVDEALHTMKQHKVRRLPVIDGHTCVGIVSQGDIAINLSEDKVGDLVEAISAAP
jgi:CBS domain-containing protein